MCSSDLILKARILLKADQGEAGERWSDEEICRALDTNVGMVARVREKLVTEGLDAVFARKKRETPPSMPAITQFREFAAAGGLMTYGGSFTESAPQVGIYTCRVLKGEKPAELPVQQIIKAKSASAAVSPNRCRSISFRSWRSFSGAAIMRRATGRARPSQAISSCPVFDGNGATRMRKGACPSPHHTSTASPGRALLGPLGVLLAQPAISLRSTWEGLLLGHLPARLHLGAD